MQRLLTRSTRSLVAAGLLVAATVLPAAAQPVGQQAEDGGTQPPTIVVLPATPPGPRERVTEPAPTQSDSSAEIGPAPLLSGPALVTCQLWADNAQDCQGPPLP